MRLKASQRASPYTTAPAPFVLLSTSGLGLETWRGRGTSFRCALVQVVFSRVQVKPKRLSISLALPDFCRAA